MGVGMLQVGRQVGVGVHDVLSAKLAAKEGFDFLWVSSFGASAVHGYPDAGLIEPEQVVGLVSQISLATGAPQAVDMDAGYGDALKIYQTARGMALAGAAAICIEDNPTSKRCSLYDVDERRLVSKEEHCERLVAAREGAGATVAVLARTEALVAGLGVDEALARAEAYVAAGAAGIFVQATQRDGGAELLAFCRAWQGRAPLVLAPTNYPAVTADAFFHAGATHVIYANQALRAAHGAMLRVFRHLRGNAPPEALEPTISTVAEVRGDVVSADFARFM